MHARQRRGGRGPLWVAAVTGVVVFGGSTAVLNADEFGFGGVEEPPRGVVVAQDPPPEPSLPLPGPVVDEPEVEEAPVADPVRVRVPALGIDAPVGALGVDEANELQVPENPADTGWWSGGAKPGEDGPAVVVGHVDSYEGPGVFHRLIELQPGDEIVVDRADGTSTTFAVGHLERHAKDAFPTEAVYGDTPDAQLRLVTCGGEFDETLRGYDDNVIAYATQTG